MMLRGPLGNVAQPDFRDHPVASVPTFTKPIRRKTVRFPLQSTSGTQWNQDRIDTPAVLRLRSRPSITPAANVEQLELWYAPDPCPPMIGDAILAAGGAAYLPTPGIWWWQVVSPFVGTCELDVELLDMTSEQGAALELDKPQATQYSVASVTVNSGTDKGVLMANAQVERKKVRIMKTSTGTNNGWVNLGDVATATNACARFVNQGDIVEFEARSLPLYSIHIFNAGLTNDTFSVAVWT